MIFFFLLCLVLFSFKGSVLHPEGCPGSSVCHQILGLESQLQGLPYLQCLPGTGAGGVGFSLSPSSVSLPSGTPVGRKANLRSRIRKSGKAPRRKQSPQLPGYPATASINSQAQEPKLGSPAFCECSHTAPSSTVFQPPSMSPT